jgi:hypothetical protein
MTDTAVTAGRLLAFTKQVKQVTAVAENNSKVTRVHQQQHQTKMKHQQGEVPSPTTSTQPRVQKLKYKERLTQRYYILLSLAKPRRMKPITLKTPPTNSVMRSPCAS